MQWHYVTRKILGGPMRGPGKIFGGQWPPWHPPSSAPGVEYISYILYFSVTPRDNGERGHCFICSFKREAKGSEVTFHNSIMGNFMVNKVYL